MNAKTDYPWWARLLIDGIKSFGITTIIVLVLLYVVVKIVIPEMVAIANRYCTAVETSQQAIVATQERLAISQDSLANTQEQIVKVVESVSSAAEEIVATEKESKDFMRTVSVQHQEQLKKLETIEEAVVEKPQL